MSHCVYIKCKNCGDEFCARGIHCSPCQCGQCVEHSEEDKRKAREALKKLEESMPEGWF